MALNNRRLSIICLIITLIIPSLFGCTTSKEKKDIKYNSAFRVMSYNIHHSRGMDGKLDMKRIAHVINKAKADIVALQEVDVNVKRSDDRNIPKELSKLTGLNYDTFGKNLDLEGGEYGNAILSKFPITEDQNTQFDSPASEQRGVLQTVIQLPDTTELLVMATHLDHKSKTDRLIYVEGIKK